ncbi:MAG: protein translocase subunit SecF [Acidobacteriota bacterium]|nr:protein translocase subunit SecF [Acidobacteriota bacterium]
MQLFKTPNFDFIRWRWHALALSVIVIAAGMFLIATRGLQKGVDFEGGTSVILKFNEPPDHDRITSALGGDAVVQQYGQAENRDVAIRVRRTGEESGGNLSSEVERIIGTLKAANVGTFDEQPVKTNVVGPVVGEQLRRQGIWATVLAMAGILIYIGLRFQFSFAAGAIVATLHDLLVCLAFLAFFRYDMTLNVVAGLLTITGYSVNDTIVIFDRVRENMRGMRRDNLTNIVNRAVNQTLSRTVITAGTTTLSVLALYLFGGEVLEGFAFTMLVGIISGTYSTVFIASALAILLQGRKPLKGQMAGASSATAPAAAATGSTRPSKRTKVS